MKNDRGIPLLILLFYLLSLSMAAQAYDASKSYFDDDEPFAVPLSIGRINLEVHAGVAPIFWSQRDCFLLANNQTNTTCANLSVGNQLTPLGPLPSFHSLYTLPADAGFRIGYAVTEKIEATFELDLHNCHAKNPQNSFQFCYTTAQATAGINTLVFNCLSHFKTYNAMVGARYYSDRCWYSDAFSFFVGIKVGLLARKEIDISVNLVNVVPDGTITVNGSVFPFTCTPLYFSSKCASGSLLVGLDWLFWYRIAFVAQVELLIQGPAHANHNIGGQNSTDGIEGKVSSASQCSIPSSPCTNLNLANPLPSTNIVAPNFNAEIAVPITFGLKYYF